MKPDTLLPVWVADLPAEFAFQPDGQLRNKMHGKAVLKIIAGPTHCPVLIDVKRPYYRPRLMAPASREAKT